MIETKLYATVDDRVEEFKNKRGETEHRNIEGPTVWESAVFELTPDNFAARYYIAKAAHPNCVVRYAKDKK